MHKEASQQKEKLGADGQAQLCSRKRLLGGTSGARSSSSTACDRFRGADMSVSVLGSSGR